MPTTGAVLVKSYLVEEEEEDRNDQLLLTTNKTISCSINNISNIIKSFSHAVSSLCGGARCVRVVSLRNMTKQLMVIMMMTMINH